MGLSCGAKMAKCLLFIFNSLFFLAGLAIMAIGIWVKVSPDTILKVTQLVLKESADKDTASNYVPLIEVSAYILIGVGVFALLVGFCGCCGAIKEHNCLLCTYTILIGLIIILQIVGAILPFVFEKQVNDKISDVLAKSLNEKYIGFPADYNDDVSKVWDAVMIGFKCCGRNSSDDFKNGTATKWYENRFYADKAENYTGDQVKIPAACCEYTNTKFAAEMKFDEYLANIKNDKCPTIPKDYYSEGCLPKIKSEIQRYAKIIIIVIVCVILVQLLVFIMACCLISANKE